jgi:putative hydrolase of the HAD superfamily
MAAAMISRIAPVVVFDLDDTLYLERDYVRSGFHAVAREIEKRRPGLADRAFAILCADFAKGVRVDSFDRLLPALPAIADAIDVDEMIGIYRNHAPDIVPIPSAEPTLAALKSRGARCALLTDGRICQQRAKLTALGLEPWFECVIVNDTRDRFKPDVRSFLQVARELDAPESQHWYVADNPGKDFIAPRQLGWQSIRLRCPGQLWEATESDDPKPDFTIGGLQAVLEIVARPADTRIA